MTGLPVVANRLDRTTVKRLLADRDFFGRFGLANNEGMRPEVVSIEKSGSVVTAKVAVDTLAIDVVGTHGVLRVTMLEFCHVSDTGREIESFKESCLPRKFCLKYWCRTECRHCPAAGI